MLSYYRGAVVLSVVSLMSSGATSSGVAIPATLPTAELPVVEANDNRKPAGVLKDGVLTVNLVVAMARWYPEASDGA